MKKQKIVELKKILNGLVDRINPNSEYFNQVYNAKRLCIPILDAELKRKADKNKKEFIKVDYLNLIIDAIKKPKNKESYLLTKDSFIPESELCPQFVQDIVKEIKTALDDAIKDINKDKVQLRIVVFDEKSCDKDTYDLFLKNKFEKAGIKYNTPLIQMTGINGSSNPCILFSVETGEVIGLFKSDYFISQGENKFPTSQLKKI